MESLRSKNGFGAFFFKRGFHADRLRLVLLGFVALSVLTSCTFRKRTIEEELADDKPALAAHYGQQALREQGQGNYEEAVKLYRKAIELVPYDPDLHNNLGTCYYYLGKIDSAISEFKEAVRLLPSYSAGYVNLANAYRLQKRYDLAIAALRESLRLDPTDAQAHTTLGLTYDEMGKLDLARKEYETAVRLAPSDLVARFNLGSAYLRMGYVNPALEHLRYVSEAEIGNERVHYLLAIGLLAKCDPAGAIAELENLRESPVLRRDASNLMGLARYLQGEFEEARRLFSTAVSIAPKAAEFRYNLALALLALSQKEEARYQLRQALKERPGWARALVQLGETFERDGDLQNAARYYRQALSSDSSRALTWQHYGRVMVDLGEIDSGYVALRKALQVWESNRKLRRFPPEEIPVIDDWRFCGDPDQEKQEYAEIFVYLGKAYAARGEQKAVDRAFRRALAAYPVYPQAYETLAEIHRLLGRKSEALREQALACWARGMQAMRGDSLSSAVRWFQKALSLVPGLAEGYIDLGRALFLSGQTDSAFAMLRKGLSIDNSKARGFTYLGDYYAQVGKLDQAIAAYLKAISLDVRQVDAFRGLADVYLQLGSDEEARKMRARFHYLRARSFLEKAQTDRALDELQETLELNPQHVAALFLTGRLLQRRNELEEAVNLLSRAVELDSTQAEGRYWLGLALLDQGQVQRATHHLEAAVRLDPTMSKAYYQLARAYLDVGQPEKAKEYLYHAQELGFPVPTGFLDKLRSAEQGK